MAQANDEPKPTYNRFGGLADNARNGTGFFRTELVNGRHWLIDPDGGLFLSKGVNAIRFNANEDINGDTPYRDAAIDKYGTEEAWAEAKVKMLHDAGFNTVGGWSDETMMRRMPYVKIINIAIRAEASGHWYKRLAADIYADEFPAIAAKACREVCFPLRDDPLLVGYLSDNELPWMKGADSHSHILLQYLTSPAKAKSHAAALDFIIKKYPTIEALNESWKSDFASFDSLKKDAMTLDSRKANLEDQLTKDCQEFAIETAEVYYSVVAKAIREADPNHLHLGTRIAWLNQLNLPVVKVSAKYTDVVSINNYSDKPFIELFEEISTFTGKPIIITEFAFRGQDSGHSNSKGAGWKTKDQTERAKMSQNFLSAAYNSPVVIGAHWFAMTDQPLSGRKQDGENSNYGIQKIDDSPWPEMMAMFKIINFGSEQLHSK